MYKKNIFSLILFSSLMLLSSCWIYPDYKEYEIIDNIYFFDDYETMKSVIIPMINKSFTDWHWSSEEFDKKYEKYFGNMDANEEDIATLSESKYFYAVRNKKSTKGLKTNGAKTEGNPKDINSEYFWITTKNNEAVIFYQQ